MESALRTALIDDITNGSTVYKRGVDDLAAEKHTRRLAGLDPVWDPKTAKNPKTQFFKSRPIAHPSMFSGSK